MNPNDPPQPPIPTRCPHCGGGVAPGAQFCPVCGQSVNAFVPPPLPPINYRQPAMSAPPRGSGVGPFFLGLAAGSFLSAVVYIPLMMANGLPDALPLVLVGTVVILKIAAIIWAFVTRRKALGAGLLTSVPIAILIFVVGCFTAVIQAMKNGQH